MPPQLCLKFNEKADLRDRRDGLVARRWLIAVGVYVGISFVGTELGLFLSCLPIERRWLPGMNSKQQTDSGLANGLMFPL